MLKGFTWNMDNYIMARGFRQENMLLTREIAERIFQLDPAPPKMENLNDYILAALEKKDLQYFSFFLHQYEPRLNRVIRGALAQDADIRYDPELLMDMKMNCVHMMLEKLETYDPSKNAEFTTYIYHDIYDAIRECQMRKESWSFKKLAYYKKVRTAAWMLNNLQNPAEEFIKKYNCKPKTAKKFLQAAKTIRNQKEYLLTDEDGDVVNEVGEDHFWNYAEILQKRVHVSAVRKAFDRLTTEEQFYLEARNAICMTCGKVEPLRKRKTFDQIGDTFEFTTANGAEKAYHRAVNRLARNLAEDNAIRIVTVRQKEVTRKKKIITTATYEYQADCDGKWGEIQFDFEAGTTEIVRLADWDTTISNVYAKKAIEIILESYKTQLPKEMTEACGRN